MTPGPPTDCKPVGSIPADSPPAQRYADVQSVASRSNPPGHQGAHRVVLFLDIDDVLCLNQPYGGYDVALALSPTSRGKKNTAPPGLWDKLFDATACEHLRRIDEEFHPVYVLSTSWARVLDDEKLRDALSRGGLGFVVDNLHPDMVTPNISGRSGRWAEISVWVQTHPTFASSWVVLDDELSGTGLDVEQPSENLSFIVRCRENVGLTEPEYVKLRAALQLRHQAARGPQ